MFGKGAATSASGRICLLRESAGPGGDTILDFYFLFKEFLFFFVGIVEKKIRRKQRGGAELHVKISLLK